jgi:hypothetical protein
VGSGRLYAVSLRAGTYALLRIVRAILDREDIAAPWSITFEDTGEHAVNVLLSVRDRPGRKGILLANQDRYVKRIRFRWPALRGVWRARTFLEQEALEPNGADSEGPHVFRGNDGIAILLPPEGVRLVTLERDEPPGGGDL